MVPVTCADTASVDNLLVFPDELLLPSPLQHLWQVSRCRENWVARLPFPCWGISGQWGWSRDVTKHPFPGWTTLAECPVFGILCTAVCQCIYTKGEFSVCVEQPEPLYPSVVPGRSCPSLPGMVRVALQSQRPR